MGKKATPSRCAAPIAAPPRRHRAMMAMATAIVAEVMVAVTVVEADIAAEEVVIAALSAL